MGLRAPVDIFGARRTKVQQQQRSQSQEEMDALKRRLASLGGLDSGSALKIEQQQQEKAAQRMQGALGEVDVQEQEFLLQQQEAEKQRQFTAGESALERRLRGELLDTQLGAEEKRLGQQLDSCEKIAGMQIGSQEKMQLNDQQWKSMENRLGEEAALTLKNMDIANSYKLKEIDAQIAKDGRISAESIAKMTADTQTNLANLEIAYKTAKDATEQKFLQTQAENELATYMMTQSLSMLELVASSNGAIKLSDVADFYKKFTAGAYTRGPNNELVPNPNWDIGSITPIAGAPASGGTTGTVTNNIVFKSPFVGRGR